MVKRALVLCAEGTHSAEGRANVARLVNAVRREAHGLDVLDGYLDVQAPALAEVIRSTAGPRAVVPLLLTANRTELRGVLAAARLDPSVSVTPPIGPDWVLAEIGVQRLVEAGARQDDTIVLAADAIGDPRAVEDVGQAARLLSAVWGGRVHVGTLAGTDTELAEAIDVARAYQRRVVLSSYLLTVGPAHDALQSAGADVVTAPLVPSGPPDPRLVALVLGRARSRSDWMSPQSDEPRLAHG